MKTKTQIVKAILSMTTICVIVVAATPEQAQASTSLPSVLDGSRQVRESPANCYRSPIASWRSDGRSTYYYSNGFGVGGEILAKYADLNEEQGILGCPVMDERLTPDRSGSYQHFEYGSIYRSPDTGAHEVHGAIRDKWASLGWERSFLGYPTTDELVTPDQRGRFNHFEGGSIYWTPQTGAHEVHGAIRDKWASLGWERSFLGYPTTDELVTPDQRGRFNHFEGGSIYWTPQTGAHEVHGAIRDKWASLGWERSFLGYPTSDELVAQNGRDRYQYFEHGYIYWGPEIGAYALRSS